jgi:hypothetical protein
MHAATLVHCTVGLQGIHSEHSSSIKFSVTMDKPPLHVFLTASHHRSFTARTSCAPAGAASRAAC